MSLGYASPLWFVKLPNFLSSTGRMKSDMVFFPAVANERSGKIVAGLQKMMMYTDSPPLPPNNDVILSISYGGPALITSPWCPFPPWLEPGIHWSRTWPIEEGMISPPGPRPVKTLKKTSFFFCSRRNFKEAEVSIYRDLLCEDVEVPKRLMRKVHNQSH